MTEKVVPNVVILLRLPCKTSLREGSVKMGKMRIRAKKQRKMRRKQNSVEARIWRNVRKSIKKEVLENRSEKQRKIQQKSEENSEIMLRLPSETKVGAFSRACKNQRKVKTKRCEVRSKWSQKWCQNECKMNAKVNSKATPKSERRNGSTLSGDVDEGSQKCYQTCHRRD